MFIAEKTPKVVRNPPPAGNLSDLSTNLPRSLPDNDDDQGQNNLNIMEQSHSYHHCTEIIATISIAVIFV